MKKKSDIAKHHIVLDGNNFNAQVDRVLPPIVEYIKREYGIILTRDIVFNWLFEQCIKAGETGTVYRYLTDSDMIEAAQWYRDTLDSKGGKNKDGRAANKKDSIIRPEPGFWEEVEHYTNTYKQELWKNSKGNPTQYFIEHLASKNFVGYRERDSKFEHPISLTKSTIRDRLIEHFRER